MVSHLSAAGLLLAIWTAAGVAVAPAANDLVLDPLVPLGHDRSIRLATGEQARQVLSTRDRFAGRLSPLDRKVRLGTPDQVSTNQFLRFAADQARPWSGPEGQKLRGILESIRPRLAPYVLALPPETLLVHTSGREESNAAYCRDNAVILPDRRVHESPDSLERLLIHELFHVISGHHPGLRRQLYAIVGFHPCPGLRRPEWLRSRVITNPDAPDRDWCIRVHYRGRPVDAVPLLYWPTDQYDPGQNGSIFDRLQFRLLAVQRRDDHYVAIEVDGQPLLLQPGEVPDYLVQTGRNTEYVIHPEEILADDFVLLVDRPRSLPSPWVLDAMREAFDGWKSHG